MIDPELEANFVPLLRIATLEQWEAGRAARRELAMTVTGGKALRRASGDLRKDALLRQMFDGERGLPFDLIDSPAERSA